MHKNNVQHVHEDNMGMMATCAQDEMNRCTRSTCAWAQDQQQDEHRDDMINIRRECNTGMDEKADESNVGLTQT